jgi:hypothetical protein
MAFFARLCPAANEIFDVAAVLPLPVTCDTAHHFCVGITYWLQFWASGRH